MRIDSAGVVRRSEQRVGEIDNLDSTLTHGDKDRSILNVEGLKPLDIPETDRGGVLVVGGPQEPTLEHRPSAGVDDRRAMSSARREEQRRRPEMSRLSEQGERVQQRFGSVRGKRRGLLDGRGERRRRSERMGRVYELGPEVLLKGILAVLLTPDG